MPSINMADHDLIQPSRILTRILTFIGLWPIGEEQPYRRYLRLLVWHLPTTFLYTSLMWVDAAVSKDIVYTANVLCLALTETSLLVKIYCIVRNGSLTVSMLHNWQTTRYALQTQEEREFWKKLQKRFGYVSLVYIGFSMCAVYSAFSSVIFQGYSLLPKNIK